MKRFDNLFVLGLTFLLSPLGALAQMAPADQGTINLRDGNPIARRETARPLRLTVPPNGQAPITMATLPDAICSLHVEGDTTQSVKLFADEEGMVRFHAGGSAEANLATQFVLDCAADGVAQTFPLELRPNSVPTMDMPAPAEEVRNARPGAFVRPGLTEFEAAALSDEELATRGYPRRPDSKDSKAHASWLTAVTQPMTFIPPRQVANPERSHGPAGNPAGAPYTANWSGFQLEGTLGSYAAVEGTWTVPALKPETNSAESDSALWVGLDGYNTFAQVNGTNQIELVQAGTAQQSNVIISCCGGASGIGGEFHFTYDYAFTQFLPQETEKQFAPATFPVNPGDVINCQVFIDSAKPVLGVAPNLSAPYAWFIIQNVTQRWYTQVPTPRNSTNVPGYQAEWIMERPTVNPGTPKAHYTDLANYGTAAISGAYALLNNSSIWVPANSSNTMAIKMVSGFDSLGHPAGNLLSSPAGAKTCPTPTTCRIVPDEVLFTWQNWK